MRQNLLETYKPQLQVADAYVSKNFGTTMSSNTKLTTAVLLDNTNRYMTEAMNTDATQRSDLGDWKKFCLNLTNIAVPSLIANNLVIVHPMTSFSGSVAYLEYVSKTNKGNIHKGDEFNSVFRMGDPEMDKEARANFTAQVIVESLKAGEKLGLTPMASGKFVDAEGNVKDAKVIVDGEAQYLTADELKAQYVDYAAAADAKIYYFSEEFQMEHVPAQDIPTIGPRMKRIALVAEPRHIAVKYDQITAFQAKTDYGFSLDKQIAEQACGELAYEIDVDIVRMLDEHAELDESLVWSKTLPVGVSKFEHYNGFLEIVEKARTIIYKRTRKFHPNYMVIAADILPVLKFVNGWKGANVSKMNGPYKVGELDGLDVYVTPELEDGRFFFGLNGSDMMSSAAVYAPYMAIVPTQLLGTPDGALQQGFSTWYAKAMLNPYLLVAGKIVA